MGEDVLQLILSHLKEKYKKIAEPLGIPVDIYMYPISKEVSNLLQKHPVDPEFINAFFSCASYLNPRFKDLPSIVLDKIGGDLDLNKIIVGSYILSLIKFDKIDADYNQNVNSYFNRFFAPPPESFLPYEIINNLNEKPKQFFVDIFKYADEYVKTFSLDKYLYKINAYDFSSFENIKVILSLKLLDFLKLPKNKKNPRISIKMFNGFADHIYEIFSSEKISKNLSFEVEIKDTLGQINKTFVYKVNVQSDIQKIILNYRQKFSKNGRYTDAYDFVLSVLNSFFDKFKIYFAKMLPQELPLASKIYNSALIARNIIEERNENIQLKKYTPFSLPDDYLVMKSYLKAMLSIKGYTLKDIISEDYGSIAGLF